MKKLVVSLLLMSGLAMAATKYSEGAIQPHKRMAWWTQLALSTQSPRIKLSKQSHYQTAAPGYRVVSSKDTINAYVPYGK
jgi:hypothetical protein